MGVPNFYSWLIRRYPLCIYDIDEHHTQKTDFLYLDMNQVIYKCATNPSVLFKDQVRQRNYDEIWISIFNYISNIVELINPQLTLFLTFDGVAPRAKMNQQRQRRFQSARRYSKLSKQLQQIGVMNKNDSFKNNQISPGTDFMHELNQQLKFFIQRKFFEDVRWNHLQVIFSGSDVPGEGEHKILQYIRSLQQQQEFNKNWTHVIYGADADLIMLGLLTQLPFISILRENMKFKPEISAAANRSEQKIQYQIINLTIVRQYMDLEYKLIKMKMQYSITRIIDDFIMLCFFVGNDFLPRIYCFDIPQGTLEALIEIFKTHLKNAESYIIDRGEINFKEFSRLLQALQGFEKLAMSKREEEMRAYLKKSEMIDMQIQKELTVIEQLNKLNKDQELKARKQFYKSKCEIDVEEDIDKIHEMVINYLEGVQFVLYYYFKGVPSWAWFYKFYYAPLCADICALANHLEDQQNIFNFQLDKPFPAFLQLICILSQENVNLLPKEYHHLLVDENSPLRKPIDFYPQDFEIDPYGALWDHQHIAKIPFLNEELVKNVYSNIKCIDEKNKQGKTLSYQKGDNYNGFKSLLPSYFEDFQIDLDQVELDIENGKDCLELIVNRKCFQGFKELMYVQTAEPSLPSLNILQVSDQYLQLVPNDERNSQVLRFFLDQILEKDTILNIIKEQNHQCFCFYPVVKECELLAYIDRDSVYKNPDIDYKDIKQLEKPRVGKELGKLFDQLAEQIYQDLERVGLELDLECIVFVRVYKSYVRSTKFKAIGNPGDQYQTIIPLQFLYPESPIRFEGKYDDVPLMNNKVILMNKDYLGGLGYIKNYIYQNLIEVQIIDAPPIISFKHLQKPVSYNLQYVAQKLDITINTVLYILGSVIIELDPTKESQQNLAEKIDIGLNLINSFQNKIVPELVKLHKAQSDLKGQDKYKQFEKLELTQECVDLLVSYRNKCPQLFMLVNKRKPNKGYPLKSTDLFSSSQDSNIDLFKIYLWILQLPSSSYTLQSIASKVAKLKITEMTERRVDKAVQIHQSFAFQQNIIFMAPQYKEHPNFHSMGDRVVNLKQPFGIYGTVVGIIDDGNTVYVQVLWDQNYIGFTNLGGRYDLLQCSTCKFLEIFNISKEWYKYIAENEKQWDYKIKDYYPNFEQITQISKDKDLMEKHNPFKSLDPLPEKKLNILQKEKSPIQIELDQLLLQVQQQSQLEGYDDLNYQTFDDKVEDKQYIDKPQEKQNEQKQYLEKQQPKQQKVVQKDKQQEKQQDKQFEKSSSEKQLSSEKQQSSEKQSTEKQQEKQQQEQTNILEFLTNQMPHLQTNEELKGMDVKAIETQEQKKPKVLQKNKQS